MSDRALSSFTIGPTAFASVGLLLKRVFFVCCFWLDVIVRSIFLLLLQLKLLLILFGSTRNRFVCFFQNEFLFGSRFGFSWASRNLSLNRFISNRFFLVFGLTLKEFFRSF